MFELTSANKSATAYVYKGKEKIVPIIYKDYTFPYNPETTGFKCDRSYIKHKYPGYAGNELEDFGINAIAITGSGYFFGDSAYDDFHRLYNEYMKDGVGDFRHPIFTEVTRGLMVNLEGIVEPGGKAIRYTFEIIADTEPNVQETPDVIVIAEEEKKSYNVGDIVNFHGGKHYVTSWSNAAGYNAKAGKAKITLGPNCKGNGKAHPWHLIHTDNSSNVYGWVDEGTFS